MLSAWRIVKARYAAGSFDGEGARRSGGRWNSPGTAVVYTAQSRSLAILEMLVHLESARVLPSYVLIECRFDSELVTPLQRALLPPRWRSYPAPPELQGLGDQWVNLARSPILEVPSAIVPGESNYILNPAHPRFAGIHILDSEPFELDTRLRG